MPTEARLPRPIRFALELGRGRTRRHRAFARLRGHRRRLAWNRLRNAVHAQGRRTILVALTEHMGDIVACEPIARYLRRSNPDAYIVWLINRPYRELIDANPHVDAAFSVGCLTEWVCLREKASFDEIVDLHPEGRSCARCQGYYVRAAGAHEITIENYYDYGNLLQIACLSAGLPELDDTPRIDVPEISRRTIDQLNLPRDYVVIHATSNQACRNWAPGKWQSLVRRIAAELSVPVVEIGLEAVVEPQTVGCRNLCGRLSLLETAEVIRRASLFVGIDSGPAHMANAVGTPGVILLGHYRHWHRYMPYSGDYASGANAEIVYGDGPASTIAVDEVFESVRRSIARQPSVSAG